MTDADTERDALRARFAEWGPLEFHTSPLYATLAPLVAEDDALLDLVARRTPGQQPTLVFFAAVHHLVLGRPEHPFAQWFPSVVGDGARSPDDAAAAFVAFCAEHQDRLGELIATRLVQTNVLRRAAALRLALTVVAEAADAIHLVEVGSSAGIHLCQDRYRYEIADTVGGDRDSPVTVSSSWLGDGPVPDVDRTPVVRSATGIDLHPNDPRSTEDRRWLRALVWPENRYAADELGAALDLVATDPPRLLAGDAVDLCPRLDAELPPGEPRVAFHAATRGHVPKDRRPAFDAAVLDLGRSAPLHVVTLEGPRHGEPRRDTSDPQHVLRWRPPGGDEQVLAHVEAHGRWIQPVRPGW